MTNGVLGLLDITSATGIDSLNKISSINSIGTVNPISSISSLGDTESIDSIGSVNFSDVLQNAISDTLNDTQSLLDSAEKAEIDFALGNSDNTHDLQIAQQKANLAISYTVAVRDRFLDAYKEIMNMQI